MGAAVVVAFGRVDLDDLELPLFLDVGRCRVQRLWRRCGCHGYDTHTAAVRIDDGLVRVVRILFAVGERGNDSSVPSSKGPERSHNVSVGPTCRARVTHPPSTKFCQT